MENLTENDKHHILQDKHNWNKLVPNPNDPDNWSGIAILISKVLAEGVEKIYKNGPAFIRTLEIDGKIVEVTYRIIDGVVKISDAWVK